MKKIIFILSFLAINAFPITYGFGYSNVYSGNSHYNTSGMLDHHSTGESTDGYNGYSAEEYEKMDDSSDACILPFIVICVVVGSVFFFGQDIADYSSRRKREKLLKKEKDDRGE